MSLHQIIYTSCMRGMNGVNDGQQVYSYDASFKDVNNDEVKRLFSYQHPVLDAGVTMTEEIARTLPKSFIYRKLGNGTCALALNTYLGRDYMGSAGRFGNHLSHVVLADMNDIQHYPCEFYGSGLLRDHMKFEEVNNPNRPDFLPQPIMERGFVVDIDTVIEFLGEDNRFGVFMNMLHAVLAFERERKRVVICDKTENIIMWIAAIEYSMPLKSALGINFSTYDFDPSLSSSRICGVCPKGTRYSSESHKLHFTFDFYNSIFAEFEKDEYFYEFIDMAMTFSYDSLQDFHRFLEEGYSYDKADEMLYAGYGLYSLLSDGVTGMPEERIRKALEFANGYALPQQQKKIIQRLIEQQGVLLKLEPDAFLCIMSYIAEHVHVMEKTYYSEIKAIMIDKLLFEFVNTICGEDKFIRFYDTMDALCRTCSFGIATELMQKYNCEKLFVVLQNEISTWKIAFIVKIISTYVKEQRISVMDLMPETVLGQTYYGLVQTVYSKNRQSGSYLVTRILDEFASDCNYLVNMALNIEGMLLDLLEGNQEVTMLWKYFGQLMLEESGENWETAYNIFSDYRRYELMYMLYCNAMEYRKSIDEYQLIFKEHYKKHVARTLEYALQYKEKIMSYYYERLMKEGEQESYRAKVDLFHMILREKENIPFTESLIKDIVKPMPFKSPTAENRKLIKDICEYLYDTLQNPLTEKVQLLFIALVFEECKEKSQLQKTFENLQELIQNDKIDMSRMTEKAAEQYFEWILPNICKLCESKQDIERLYTLFNMSSDISGIFFEVCTKIYLKQSKVHKDYNVFCELLGVIFEYGNAGICEETGKELCKLNKQTMAELNDLVMERYSEDRRKISHWNKMKEVAEKTNPIFNNISNLFKRRKN